MPKKTIKKNQKTKIPYYDWWAADKERYKNLSKEEKQWLLDFDKEFYCADGRVGLFTNDELIDKEIANLSDGDREEIERKWHYENKHYKNKNNKATFKEFYKQLKIRENWKNKHYRSQDITALNLANSGVNKIQLDAYHLEEKQNQMNQIFERDQRLSRLSDFETDLIEAVKYNKIYPFIVKEMKEYAELTAFNTQNNNFIRYKEILSLIENDLNDKKIRGPVFRELVKQILFKIEVVGTDNNIQKLRDFYNNFVMNKINYQKFIEKIRGE